VFTKIWQSVLAESEWHALAVGVLILVAAHFNFITLSSADTDIIVGSLVGYAALRLSGKTGTAMVQKIQDKESSNAPSDSSTAAPPSSAGR